MSFFYDLNKKLDGIRATPEVTHQQLNERDMGKHNNATTGFKALAKKAGGGEKGERIAGAQFQKMKKAGQLEEQDMDAQPSAAAKKKTWTPPAARTSTDEGVMDTVKSVGKRVAGGINRLVGHGSDEDMRKAVQRKAGVPQTGKMPQQQVKEKMSPAKQQSFAALAPPADKITFADKIAGAKKEVDEMLGDVAAEAMRSALSPKQKGIAKLSGNPNKIDGGDLAALRKGRKPEMDEENDFTAHKRPAVTQPRVGSTERGHKHDIKHTATGRMVTRRTDPQGNSVGADDASDAQAGPRGRGRPKGTKGAIGAKGPSGKSKLMTREGDNESSELKAAMMLLKKSGYKVTKAESTDTRDDHAERAGKKVTKDIEYDEGHKGKDDNKAEKAGKKVTKDIEYDEKKKAVDEDADDGRLITKKTDDGQTSTTSSTGRINATIDKGQVTVKPAKTGSMSFGKGIYDSMNRELESMIAESMSINMSDSTEGNKSLTITATDDDALKLAMMLKAAGLGGGDQHGDDMHSHEETCPTCGMEDCGCGDVQEAVDENAPDWPTNTETSDNALQYSGGLNKPKTDVAGDGQTTIPNTAVHTQDEDMLRRLKETAGINQANLKPWERTMKEDTKDACHHCHKDPCECDEDIEEDFLESIQRMRKIAGIKEAKRPDYPDVDGDKKEPLEKALKDKEEKKVDESIFALTNQWKAYKG